MKSPRDAPTIPLTSGNSVERVHCLLAGCSANTAYVTRVKPETVPIPHNCAPAPAGRYVNLVVLLMVFDKQVFFDIYFRSKYKLLSFL